MLATVLPAVAAQDWTAKEIILVDNDSTDASLSLARHFDCRIVRLPQGEFTYGRAINRGIEASTGEFILLLSAHSLPLGRDFIRKALARFDDARVAAVRCMLVSKTRDLENWVESGRLRWPVDFFSIVEQGPIASGCMLRRSVWEEIRFDESLEAVEDKMWAHDALRAGYLIERSEAFYLHMRKRRMLESIRIMNRDRLAVFRATGKHWPSPQPTLVGLAKAVLLSAPKAALQLAAREILTYCYLKTIPLQARRGVRAGAIQ
jgi:glycosyltransferase involved in cell wall biosynthesis